MEVDDEIGALSRDLEAKLVTGETLDSIRTRFFEVVVKVLALYLIAGRALRGRTQKQRQRRDGLNAENFSVFGGRASSAEKSLRYFTTNDDAKGTECRQ